MAAGADGPDGVRRAYLAGEGGPTRLRRGDLAFCGGWASGPSDVTPGMRRRAKRPEEDLLLPSRGRRCRHDRDVTFEETLAILHGWLGRELEVAIRTGDATVIAHMTGPLAAGSDLSARGHAGPIFFQLGPVGATGFFVGEADFRTSWWIDKEQTLLGVSVGDIQLLIDSVP